MLLLLASLALAQEPTLDLPSGCAITCGTQQHLTVEPGVYMDRDRAVSLVEGAAAWAECAPALDTCQARAEALGASLAKQERLTRRARMQRNGAAAVLGGVVLGLVVVVVVD